jgi:cobalt/nickel transport system permease protein
MHFSPFDLYRAGESILHRLDPRVKLGLTLAFILSVSLTPAGAWPTYVLLLSVALSAAVASELGLRFTMRRAAVVLPFVLAALPVMFTVRGAALASAQLGPWRLTVTQPGLERFASVALKSWLSVQMAVLLTATTSVPDLLLAMRSLGLPRLLVAVVGLMWRYLAVLVDEALRMMRARDSRSGSWDGWGGGSLVWRAHVTGAMAGTLFLRGYERSERIHNAMLSRGYDGHIRSYPVQPLSPAERLMLVATFALLMALVALGYLLG